MISAKVQLAAHPTALRLVADLALAALEVGSLYGNRRCFSEPHATTHVQWTLPRFALPPVGRCEYAVWDASSVEPRVILSPDQ
jgi:hypothetical protein